MTEPVKLGPVQANVAVPTQVKPVSPNPVVPVSSLTQQVNVANARVSPLVKKLQERTKSTFDLDSIWARILIHGEIDSLKTTVAHHFGTPEQCRTILTRGEDQMTPVVNEGYKYLKVDNGEEFVEALSYPDAIWPDWAKHPEPILIIDDITRARDFVVKASKTYESGTGQTKEYKDTRKIYGVALEEFDAMFSRANAKKIHIVMTAVSKVVEGKVSMEETVMPDLSPSIGNLVMSDYSYIFFLNKKKPVMSRMLTSMDYESVTEWDESQKKAVSYQRYYFARHKLPAELISRVPPIIQKYEPADLRAVWNKIMAAKKRKV